MFQDIVFKPVTTPCHHNFCLSCIERSFSSTGESIICYAKIDLIDNFFASDKKTCSNCRNDLGDDYEPTVNTNLKAVLNAMFPGYEVGR